MSKEKASKLLAKGSKLAGRHPISPFPHFPIFKMGPKSRLFLGRILPALRRFYDGLFRMNHPIVYERFVIVTIDGLKDGS